MKNNMMQFFRATGVIFILAIWVGSLIPLNNLAVPGSDKLHHLVAYGSLMTVWMLATPQQKMFHHGLIAFALMTMGLAIETAQGLTAYRFFEWADALANSAGVLLGWALGAVALRLQSVFTLKRSVTAS